MEKEFEKKLKDILNNPPDLPVDEDAWNSMQERLNRNSLSSGGNMLQRYWPLLLLFLAFLGTGAWFCLQLEKANSKIESLEKQLDNQREIIPDTVTRFKTIYKKDTVIKYIHSSVQRSSSTPSNISNSITTTPPSSFSSSYSSFNLYTTGTESTPPIPYQPTQLGAFYPSFSSSLNISTSKNKKRPETITDSGIKPAARVETFLKAPVPTIANRKHTPEVSSITSQLVQELSKPKKSLYRQRFHPKASVALLGGIGTFHASASSNHRTILAGVLTEVSFSRRFRLVTGLEWQLRSYQTDRYSSFDGKAESTATLPTSHNISNAADRGAIVRASNHRIIYPIGAKLLLMPNQAIRPYISGGIQAEVVFLEREQRIYFDSDNQLRTLDLGAFSLNGPRGFSFNNLWIAGGMQLNWSRQWGLRIEALYNYKLKFGVEEKYRFKQIGIRGGFHYDF